MTSPLARATVQVTADTRGFERQLRRNIQEELRGAERDSDRSFKRISGLAKKAGDEAGRSFGSRLSNAISGTSEALQGLGSAALGVGALSSAIGAVASVTPALFAFTAAVASTANALFLLPAAGAAAGAVFATLKLGLSGVGEAFKALSEGDAEKFNEALKDLAPNARTFFQELKKLTPEFSKFRTQVQQALFADLAREIRPIVTNLFPAFRSGTVAIAESLNDVGVAFAGFLRETETSSVLTAVMDRAAESISLLQPGLIAAADAMRSLISVGSSFLPQLASSLSSALSGFADRIREAAETGELEGRIRRAIEVLGQLGRIAGNTAAAIGNIFQGAVESEGLNDILTSIEDLTEKLRNFTAEADGERVRAFFDTLRAVAPIAVGVGLLSSAIGVLASTVGFLLTPVGAVTAAFAVIGVALVAAYQNIEPFRNAVDALAAGIGSLISDGLAVLVPWFTDELIPAFHGALAAAQPLINGLVAGFTQFILPAVRTVISAYKDQLQPILETISSVVSGTITPAIQKLSNAYLQNKTQIDLVIAVVGSLIGFFGRLGAVVSGTVIKLLIQLAGVVIGTLIGGVARLVGWIGNLITAWNAASSAVASFRNGAQSAVSSVIQVVSSLPGRVLGAIGNLGGVLYNAGRSLISGFARGIRDAASAAISAARSMVSSVRNFFPFSPAKEGPFSGRGWVLYSGRAISEAFALGIDQSINDVISAVNRVAAVSTQALGVAPGVSPLSQVSPVPFQGTPVGAGVAPLVSSPVNNSTVVNVSLPTGDPEAAAMAVMNRIAAGVG